MNHVTSYSTSEGDVTWDGFKSMFIYATNIIISTYFYRAASEGMINGFVYIFSNIEAWLRGLLIPS